MRKLHLAAAFAVIAAFGSTAEAAPILGMIDTFQSGTTEGWFAGGGPFGATPPIPPHVVPTGGPTGLNDAFLEVIANGGSGPGSRLVAMNAAQWAGDFTAIPTIEMDVINLGTTDVTVRILFENPAGGPPTDIAITGGVSLAAGSGWTHAAFAIDAAALTPLLGTVADLMSDVTLIRLIHSTAASFPGDPIAGLLGVDNISAGPVPRPGPFDSPSLPEPGGLLLVATGVAIGMWRAAVRRSAALD